MKITFFKDQSKSKASILEEVEAPLVGLEVSQMGVRFIDPDLNTPRMMTFNKFKAFTVEATVSEDQSKSSSEIQAMRSDRIKKRQ